MRILVVGSDKVYAIENFYVKYLRANGLDVIHYPAQSMFNDFYQKNLLNRLIFRVGLSSIYASINDELIEIARKERPQIVWVFKGMEIFPKTLRILKNMGARLVNFNGDNPFIFSGRGSGNSNVSESLDCYDLHLTYNNSVFDEFNRRGLAVDLLPFGFDLPEHVFEEVRTEGEVNRICFLGNPDKERSAYIQKLADAGVPVTVYGNAWSSFVKSPNIETHGPVYGKQQWRVLRRYRVQLNLMRRHNLESHNMRTFEVPSIGGIMLAPDTPDHRRFFNDKQEAFLFREFSECLELARKLLSFSTEQSEVVRFAARARSVSSGYSYEHRTAQILQLLKQRLS